MAAKFRCKKTRTGWALFAVTVGLSWHDPNDDLLPARFALASRRRQSDQPNPSGGCPTAQPLPRQGWNKSRRTMPRAFQMVARSSTARWVGPIVDDAALADDLFRRQPARQITGARSALQRKRRRIQPVDDLREQVTQHRAVVGRPRKRGSDEELHAVSGSIFAWYGHAAEVRETHAASLEAVGDDACGREVFPTSSVGFIR